MGMDDLTVIVPVYNEAENLPSFMKNLVFHCKERSWKIVVINDGSTDSTDEILQSCTGYEKMCVVSHKLNKGYGAALKSGIRRTDTTYGVTLDGDGQHHMSDIDKVLAYALEKDADLVVGNRGEKASSTYRRIGKSIIRFTARLLMDVPVYDLNSGFKLHRIKLAKKYIRACPDSMAFSEFITLMYINQRDLVLEYPVEVRERQGGESTINILTAFEAMSEIINFILLFRPLKVFLFLSFSSIFMGIAWGARFVLLGRGVSVGAMLAIVIGVLLFSLGLLAKQLSAIYLNMISSDQHELE